MRTYRGRESSAPLIRHLYHMTQIVPTPVPVAILGAARTFKSTLRVYVSKVSFRAFVGTCIALAAMFVAFLYFSEISSVRAVSAAPQLASDKVYLGTPVAGAVVSVTEKTPMLEMHIANNGLVLLRGARVISNSRGTIRGCAR